MRICTLMKMLFQSCNLSLVPGNIFTYKFFETRSLNASRIIYNMRSCNIWAKITDTAIILELGNPENNKETNVIIRRSCHFCQACFFLKWSGRLKVIYQWCRDPGSRNAPEQKADKLLKKTGDLIQGQRREQRQKSQKYLGKNRGKSLFSIEIFIKKPHHVLSNF